MLTDGNDFQIEGQLIRMREMDGHRLWSCNCEAFQEDYGDSERDSALTLLLQL